MPKKLDAANANEDKIEAVSYIDDEAKFRWALFDDTMAFDKLHEGIRGFAKDGESGAHGGITPLTTQAQRSRTC